MARAKSLADLAALVRKYADLGPATTTGRHTTSEVYRAVQDSWQSMRELVSNHGRQLYLTQDYHAAGTMLTTPQSGELFGVLALPATAAKVYGLSIVVTAQDVRSLPAYDFDTRNMWISDFGTRVGTPAAYSVFSMGAANAGGTALDPGKIALFPCPDRSYAYTIWYLPAWVDIAEGSASVALFDGIVGFDDWVVWDAVLKFCAADNDMQNAAQIATQEREKAEQRLLTGANVQRAPQQRADMRAISPGRWR